jgi:hypothetical protein
VVYRSCYLDLHYPCLACPFGDSMKPEYIEGPKALENFERLATAVLQAPRPTKKGKRKDKPSASQRKPKSSDKD